jgi:hypothetical protein
MLTTKYEGNAIFRYIGNCLPAETSLYPTNLNLKNFTCLNEKLQSIILFLELLKFELVKFFAYDRDTWFFLVIKYNEFGIPLCRRGWRLYPGCGDVKQFEAVRATYVGCQIKERYLELDKRSLLLLSLESQHRRHIVTLISTSHSLASFLFKRPFKVTLDKKLGPRSLSLCQCVRASVCPPSYLLVVQ